MIQRTAHPRAATPPRALQLADRIWPIAGALAVLAALALGLDRGGGPGGAPSFSAIPDVLRAAAAAALLFGACGYTLARLLLPPSMQPHLPLLVLPIGAVSSSLALTLLGVFGVPLAFSLAALILAGGGSAVLAHRRGAGGPTPRANLQRAGSLGLRLLWPAAIAIGVAALMASPQLRADSLATVLGQNGDAHMATGAAELLQHAPPGAERPELPIDHMPQVWRSKYPIYYALAGVSTLSGLDPVQTFSTLIAIVGGLTAVGLFLVAFHVAGAPAAAAVLATGLVAVDRIVFHLALAPFYNQLWGLFSLPFVLVFGWRFLWEPSRGTLSLLIGFAALSGLAYPLLVPFPALFLAITAVLVWRRRRDEAKPVRWIAALRLPRGRRSVVLWLPLALFALPIALLFFLAAFEKMQAAILALLPGGDLAPWSGDAIGFESLTFFLGLPDGQVWLVGVVVVLALAVLGLRAAPREAGIALGGMLGALLLAAVWLQLRGEGALFHFRALSFFAPVALTMTGVGAASLLGRTGGARRAALLCGIAALVSVLALGARSALVSTFPHAGPEVWELRSWSDRLPGGASIRVDVTPTGVQQWAGYMLSEHPLSALDPLRFFFPHPPIGRKADFLLVNADRTHPRDSLGAPLLSNRRFSLYAMDPDVPGPDVSSQRLIDPQLTAPAPAE
ncbi:MAG: hypothetical protein M3481_07480 [Actinomycetota bacterium]|nr:hypothetical protein [Actinomycetota bacterium]